MPGRRRVGRYVGALGAALGLVLGAGGAARATQTVEIPANAPGGVSATVTFERPVVPQPYTPDPTDYWGPNRCLLTYHVYEGTPGCGGFVVDVALHDVRTQPGFLAGVDESAYFTAKADTERTFGCLRADGTFDWGSAFVVRLDDVDLGAVHYETSAYWVVQTQRADPANDVGPAFYMNFPAVDFTCPEGQVKWQYGLKVSDLRVSIADSPVFGTQTWRHDGAYYA
ncbi:hypothetical protein [Streptomyces sp. VRA16 Mangrove soil]|uniref:hypothetical protein n=1 Tax=Streptomyces sp. VRA16 Mangrove soil TaxID=2817434 RepID=UPI001A9CE21D|nr:hypothetical protein [Streptomyces sp. VRA16 Mangrove soil]MBO1336892.1 hypothetical protein [Streptomyces sp. VRA16 Mangrove soil]